MAWRFFITLRRIFKKSKEREQKSRREIAQSLGEGEKRQREKVNRETQMNSYRYVLA